MHDIDRLNPTTWLVMGNALSSNREHEMAVQCFKRAIALSPDYAMAYTLCGLEYVLLEDFEQAGTYLEKAVCINPRDFKAWYGLGDICFKTEKYVLCEVYLSRALEIHPTNLVLMNQMALVCSFFTDLWELIDSCCKRRNEDKKHSHSYRLARHSRFSSTDVH